MHYVNMDALCKHECIVYSGSGIQRVQWNRALTMFTTSGDAHALQNPFTLPHPFLNCLIHNSNSVAAETSNRATRAAAGTLLKGETALPFCTRLGTNVMQMPFFDRTKT